MRLSDIMGGAGLAGYAQAALILFALAFLGIVIALFRPSQKARMDHDSRLPFDDDPAGKPEEDHRS